MIKNRTGIMKRKKIYDDRGKDRKDENSKGHTWLKR
jgi:hypothetical protein